MSYDETLVFAIPEGIDLDEYTVETVACLIAAYFDHYGSVETTARLLPEVKIPERKLEGTDFTVSGVMDALGQMHDGRHALIEGKTTGDSLDPNSDYWLRLRFNMQVLQYVVEARHMGIQLDVVFYDVCRKPSIQPKMVTDLDEEGRKIVYAEADSTQERIWNKAKKDGTIEPRQSADKAKGWIVKQHLETPSEFSARLYADIKERPQFYFARQEVPIIESELIQFEMQRLALGGLIEHMREQESGNWNLGEPGTVAPRDPEAWPRSVSCDTCDFCQYKSFCLQNLSIDINNPPQGFEIQAVSPELQKP